MSFKFDISKINKTDKNNHRFSLEQVKTTNINILLNRVMLDKKKELKNKLFISSIVILTVTLIGIFTII